jgi:SAM-dependent methyltransferase
MFNKLQDKFLKIKRLVNKIDQIGEMIINVDKYYQHKSIFQEIQKDCSILHDISLSKDVSNNLHLMEIVDANIMNSFYLKAHGKRLNYTFNLIRELSLPGGNKTIADLGSWVAYLPILKDIFPKNKLFLCIDDDLNSFDIESLKNNVETASVNLEIEPLPIPDNSVSLVILLEVIEHFAQDPMFVMSEINRVLVDGGKVLVSTPNLASWRALSAILTHYSPYTYGKYIPGIIHARHIHEYVPRDVSILLQSAGFKDSVWTKNMYHTANSPKLMECLEELGLPTTDREDTIFAVGTKLTTVKERYPIDLYDIEAMRK